MSASSRIAFSSLSKRLELAQPGEILQDHQLADGALVGVLERRTAHPQASLDAVARAQLALDVAVGSSALLRRAQQRDEPRELTPDRSRRRGAEDAQRGRIGGADASAPVGDQHAALEAFGERAMLVLELLHRFAAPLELRLGLA
jgi:hypothetical protein